MRVEKKRCNHPDHEGPRYLPVTEFHKQGRKNGKQMYRAQCKTCANKDERLKWKNNDPTRKKEWAHKKAYIRARSRALTRLSKLTPELYQMCLEEELAKELEFNK